MVLSQPMNDSKIKESLTLKDLDQIKALADPLRLQVLEAFCHKPMTTKQVAVLLEENPTKLYHHVDILERAGLIRLVKTQQNRGTVEKYYQGSAKKFAVDRKLFEVGCGEESSGDDLANALTSVLELSISEIRKSIAAKLIRPDAKPRTAMAASALITTTAHQTERLMDKIKGWMGELHFAADRDGDMVYRMTIAFHPVKKIQKKAAKPSHKSEKSEDL
jgi:DNA-binding transcriptional ArsR family regulator